MEQALYNTVLGGMNYEGNRFFYVNPLEAVPEVSKANPSGIMSGLSAGNGSHVPAVRRISQG